MAIGRWRSYHASTMRKVCERRQLRALRGLCVAGGLAIVVLGTVDAHGDKPVPKGDTVGPEADMTGATAAPGTDEPRGSVDSHPAESASIRTPSDH